jgi:phenylacetate-CoA ligase
VFADTLFRWRLRDAKGCELDGRDLNRVIIQPDKRVHITPVLYQTKIYPNDKIQLLPANTPISTLVSQLNALNPTHLEGFPSIVYQLAQCQLDSLLNIQPMRIGTNSEMLTASMRETIQTAWPGIPVNNHWGSTDSGSHAVSCDYSEYGHLHEDRNIIEPVDQCGSKVPAGTACEKIYTTCLYNFTFPLIRYELTDKIRVQEAPCPCGSNYSRIEILEGSLDADFMYGDILIRPNVVFNGCFVAFDEVNDYQVLQTKTGVAVDVLLRKALDATALSEVLEHALAREGVVGAEVHVRIVDRLQRHPETNKLKRYVPLQE